MQFEELISLDPETLQQTNPIGVIFLFKYPTGEKQPKDKPLDGEFDFAAVEAQGEENVWFAAQTIQNACGTQALLSVLLNKTGPKDEGGVEIGPNLKEFKDFTSAFPADVSPHFPIDNKLHTKQSYAAPRRSSLELRPHPRHPQLLRPQLALHLRRNPHSHRRRRRLPLHRLHQYQQHPLRVRWPPTRTNQTRRCRRVSTRDIRRCSGPCATETDRKVPAD